MSNAGNNFDLGDGEINFLLLNPNPLSFRSIMIFFFVYCALNLVSDVNMEAGSGLANDLKNKLQILAKEPTDVLESLSPNVRKRVDALREIQSRHDEVEAKFLEERAALEAKYQKLYQPLHAKRYNIVNGVGQAEGTTNDMDMTRKSIHLLKITELDEGALMYLKDIKWRRMEVPKGFKLEFYFDTNPYFKNTLLTKIYHMIDEDDPVLEKTIGTEIEWYPGKCLTQKVIKKDCQSFFNFFDPPHVPDDDDDDDEDIGEYTAEELQSLMEQDYDIGSTIRDQIIPHAVSWFTGEAAPGYEPDTDDDDDDDDDDDYLFEDDDEDEVDDEEEEDEEEKMRIRKKSARARGDGQQGAKPTDCK
ncbi:hypothetical protein V6N11_066822 [Hibiscus sabdariffa]|uniref:Nucleosome assembly protein n=1 Tax=Hibiscus sabdariffa TaxID=183260 RepID=A0ABR2SNX4_9ROSI